MLRISNLIRASLDDTPRRSLDGGIAIWNLTNRCNLSCRHCYSRASLESRDDLSTATILATLPQLVRCGIRFLILSGGEPLTRTDIFEIAAAARELGITMSLSTNGLYIHRGNAARIAAAFDYIGISIDGSEATHDRFRGLSGSYRRSLEALGALMRHTPRVGIRFTLTRETRDDLGSIFALAEAMSIPKIYISHLVYSGRGLENRAIDLSPEQRYADVGMILDKAFGYIDRGTPIEIVTGNMEPDALMLQRRFEQRYAHYAERMRSRLTAWGGNAAGRTLVNIDSRGNVKPDPFFPVTLGNIRETPFDRLWTTCDDPLLAGLRDAPRQLDGACRTCPDLNVCNGGSRARAYAVHGTLTAEDPSCYREFMIARENG